jgi:hypothetical protein
MGVFYIHRVFNFKFISMIKRIFLFSLICISFKANCQEPTDALRYSWLTPYGTARSMAIGGALT